jgi:hypothetical protein
MAEPTPAPVFRDPTVLTRWVQWLLYAQIAISIVAIVSGVMEYQLFQKIQARAFASTAEMMRAAEGSDLRQGIVALVQAVIMIVGGIAILMWIFRANKNARALGADLEVSAGWAVGWYFIPIANLWKPYQAMKEIWQASVNPRYWRAQNRSALLPWWWLFWLASNIASNVAFRFQWQATMAEETPANMSAMIDKMMAADIAYAVADALSVPLCVIFLPIVAHIYAMQMRWWREGPPQPNVTEQGPVPS